MRILVYGAGAVGSYLGASLLQAGNEVVLADLPQTAALLQESGLTVKLPQDSFQVHPQIVTSIEEAFLDTRPYDAILLGMKSYDVQEAIENLLACRPEPPLLITPQNGIGLEEMITGRVGLGEVVAGSLTTPVGKEAPGRISVERPDRGLALAPTMTGQDISKWVQLFASSGIPTIELPDYQAMKWSKALLNMIGNASAAILGQHPSIIYKYRPMFNLEMDMLQETLAVMKRLNLTVVDLPGTPAKKLAWALRFVPRRLSQPILSSLVAGGRGNKMPSFYIDLQGSRKKSEVLFHNVAVAEAGNKLGVATPTNATLGQTLMKIVQGKIDRSDFKDNPQRLIAEVEDSRRKQL